MDIAGDFPERTPLVKRSLAVALRRRRCSAAPLAAQHARLFPPRDLGLLEGPDRDAYQRPDQIMDALPDRREQRRRRSRRRRRMVHRAAGAARRPNGRVYAEDIQPQMIQAIERRVQREG
jgi:hypothetical protein